MARNTRSRCGARSGAVLLALDAIYLEFILRLTTDQALFARGSADAAPCRIGAGVHCRGISSLQLHSRSAHAVFLLHI